MKTPGKINLVTLGCAKNVVDSERLKMQMRFNNLEIVENAKDADTIVINTCGFIEDAKQESINTILEAVKRKGEKKLSNVIVSGCLSARYKEDLEKEIPEVDFYFGSEEYDKILKELGGDLKYELLGERELSTPKHFAYLKISEGCDNPCSFCAIPLMRGSHKSRPMESLLTEAGSLASKGVKELIIIGQDTTDYGNDIYGKRNIAELLRNISEIDGIEWIRLLYAYPSHFPDELIDEIANNPKIIKYLDMPLQHISDDVLKSMRRRISSRRTKELYYKIKERIPEITLRTTFIVGYPNETDESFTELCDFVKDIEFERLGVFTYSPEDATPSFLLGDPVDAEIKEERKAELMEIQREISEKKNQKLIGQKIKVLIDQLEGEFYIGRSKRDAPEVDGEVLINKNEGNFQIGHFYIVEIFDSNDYDLFGKSPINNGGNK